MLLLPHWIFSSSWNDSNCCSIDDGIDDIEDLRGREDPGWTENDRFSIGGSLGTFGVAVVDVIVIDWDREYNLLGKLLEDGGKELPPNVGDGDSIEVWFANSPSKRSPLSRPGDDDDSGVVVGSKEFECMFGSNERLLLKDDDDDDELKPPLLPLLRRPPPWW